MKTKARAPRRTSTSCLDSCAPKIGSCGASGRGVGHAQTIQPMQCHAMPCNAFHWKPSTPKLCWHRGEMQKVCGSCGFCCSHHRERCGSGVGFANRSLRSAHPLVGLPASLGRTDVSGSHQTRPTLASVEQVKSWCTAWTMRGARVARGAKHLRFNMLG